MNRITAEQAAIIANTINLIKGRWKLAILVQLSHRSMRFGELGLSLRPISDNILTQQLQALLEDGLIQRSSSAQIASRIEYQLTNWGESLAPVLEVLLTWSTNKQDNDEALQY